MPDALYDEFRDAILGNATHSAIDLDTDNIKIILYDEGADALDLADVDLADILSSARVATSANLTATVGTVSTGAFDHTDETFTSVSGSSVESLTYYKDSGTASTSPLIVNIDSWTGLPVTPNGGDITAAPHADGVFRINAS